jgi:hypothetical protein
LFARLFAFLGIGACMLGCTLPSGSAEYLAQQLLTPFEKKFNGNCKYKTVQVDCRNPTIYQYSSVIQKDCDFRQTFDLITTSTSIETLVKDLSNVFKEDTIERIRQAVLKEPNVFRRFIAQNSTYSFSMDLKPSKNQWQAPSEISRVNSSLTNIAQITGFSLGKLIVGMPNMSSFSAIIGKTHYVEISQSGSDFFPDCTQINFRPQSANSGNAFTLFIDQKIQLPVGTEVVNDKGDIISRYLNCYRTQEGDLVPDYQLYYGPHENGALTLNRCLIFCDFSPVAKLHENFCYLESFGYTEPPEFERNNNFFSTWNLLILLTVISATGFMMRVFIPRLIKKKCH